MAFFEERLDPCITYGARGGPVFSTAKAYTSSGRRIANRNWYAPLHRYDISHNVRKESDYESIRDFFYVVAGAFDGFRFKDWQDFEAGDRGIVIRQAEVLQLAKRYALGSREFIRVIYKPVAGLKIFRAGLDVTEDSDVDLTTGRITVEGDSDGDVYTWTGEFDVPVAFVSDEWMPEIVSRHGDELLLAGGSLQLEEIRL